MSRPKPEVAPVPVLLRLHPETVAELDRLRGDVSRSAWIAGLVNVKLASMTPPLPHAEVERVMRKLQTQAPPMTKFRPHPKPGKSK